MSYAFVRDMNCAQRNRGSTRGEILSRPTKLHVMATNAYQRRNGRCKHSLRILSKYIQTGKKAKLYNLTTRCNSSVNKPHFSPNEYAPFPHPRSGSGNKSSKQTNNHSGNKLDKEAIVPKPKAEQNKNDCLQSRSERLGCPEVEGQ